MNKFDENEMEVWRVSGNENCPHESTISIGADKGNNQYYQCQECEAIIVVEGKSSPEAERERMEREKEERKSGLDKFMEKLR